MSLGSRALGSNYMDKAVTDLYTQDYLQATSDALRGELGTTWNDAAGNTDRWRAALNAP